MCERWVGHWTKRQHIDPHSSGYNCSSFPFSWAAQPGVWGPSLCWVWFSLLELEHLLQTLISNWSKLPVALGYITIRRSPASCERHICTQFNPSTVKVIPWYLRPDSPVIYTGAFPIWQLGQVGGQYITEADIANYLAPWPNQHIRSLLAADKKGSIP